jgi:hypothetical protein
MNHSARHNMVYAILIFALILPTVGAQESSKTKRIGKPEKEQKAQTGSVSMVESTVVDYLSGEAKVAVTGNQNPVIRLGLSPNGATIIEFPSADRLFNIIPGNSNLVTVEESPTKATDRFIIARPGDGFAMPATMANARRAPAASVLVQMQSGLVLTFLFYPVPQLSEQAHRVVVVYDRNEVVAARRASGLAVNLDNLEDEKPKTSSIRIAPQPDSQTLETTPARTTPSKEPRRVADTAEIDGSLPPEKWGGMRDEKIGNPAQITGLALTEASRSPKNFKKWSDSVHGLSLSVSPVREINKRSQLVVIAARNTKDKDARILPDQPELYLETLDGSGKPIQIELVKKIATASTAKGEIIPGGETRYYALVYETPILSARQRLRVIVGQTIAADEPASTNLTSSIR